MDAHPIIKGRQEALEERARVAQSTISRVLNGKNATTLEILQRLADGVDCQAWELLVDGPEAYEEAVRRILKSGS